CSIDGDQVTTTTGTDGDGNPTLSFTAQPGASTMNCVVTNKQPKPTLTLTKVVDNGDSGATNTPSDWTLHTESDPRTYDFAGSSTGTTKQVLPDTYNLSESGPDGYDDSV